MYLCIKPQNRAPKAREKFWSKSSKIVQNFGQNFYKTPRLQTPPCYRHLITRGGLVLGIGLINKTNVTVSKSPGTHMRPWIANRCRILAPGYFHVNLTHWALPARMAMLGRYKRQKWTFQQKYNHFEKKFSKIDKKFVSQSILEVDISFIFIKKTTKFIDIHQNPSNLL